MTTKTKTSTAKKRTSIGSRRSPDAEAAVLRVARDLISEKGYAGFSVDEVATRRRRKNHHLSLVPNEGRPLHRHLYDRTVGFPCLFPTPETSSQISCNIPQASGVSGRRTRQGRVARTDRRGARYSGALSALRDRFLPERTADVRRILTDAANRGELQAHEVDDKISLAGRLPAGSNC